MNGTCRFQWEAGLAVAGTINSSLRQIAFESGVDFEIEKLGGFLVRRYGGIATGDRNSVEAFAEATRDYMQRSAEVLA